MRIALATSFSRWDDGYSLCHVVRNQANAFAELGHQVEIWGESSLEYCELLDNRVAIVPCFSKHHYKADAAEAEDVSLKVKEFVEATFNFRPELVIGHDLLFQASLIAYAAAIHKLPVLGDRVWLHMVHSNCARGERRTAGSHARRHLPFGHHLLSLGESHRRAVASHYGASPDDVFVCPNPVDFMERMDDRTKVIARELRLLERDFVQVYPLSSTRFEPKGVRWLVDLFDIMKSKGQDVCLLVCNCHANEPSVAAHIKRHLQAEHMGRDDLVFTSIRWPGMEHAVPNRVVKELTQLSNLFIFPSISEACSLALIDAQAAGCHLVLNEACDGQMDWRSPYAAQFKFDGLGFRTNYHTKLEITDTAEDGSTSVRHQELEGDDARRHVANQLVDDVIQTTSQNPVLMARRHAMRMHDPHVVARRIIDIAAASKARR